MIEARWAICIADDLRRAGIGLDGPLKEVGLGRSDLGDSETRIAYSAFVGLIERAAMLLGEPAYGLKLGTRHDVRDNGLLGFIALNSPTLGDALANVERYVAVTNEGIDAVFEHDSQGKALRFREADPALRGLRHNSEHSAARIAKAALELTRRKAFPLRVDFMHGRPNAAIDYEAVLGCPVRFHAEWDGVVFASETLGLPVSGADRKLLQVLESACRRIIGQRPRQQDLIHSVREYVVQHLAKGAAPFEAVARHVGMSGKTLERRLGERGTSYRALVDGVRFGLAKHYLVDTDFRLQQIAYLLGYSEPAPLVRAFRRWAGRTPRQYREQCREKAGR